VTTHATPLVGAALSRAVATLWAGLRVVVVDTETCVNPAGGLRIVSFAAVTCRAGSVRGKWQTLINPGTPIDRNSQRIHGVTDDHVDGEPAFIDVGASIVSQLTPADGEQVVFVAHNVGFDVGVLRAELEAAGLHLPTLPVIDTMGRLPGHVGVRPPSRGLADLLATLGLVNARPHDALADAVACAEAFVALMDCAAQQGLTDFDQLLADVSAGATTASVRPNSKAIDTPTASPAALPVEHLAQHAAVLSPRAGSRMLRTWRDEVLDCASLRCVHLTDKVAQAAVPDRKLLTELNTALLHLTGEGDVAGAATVAEATLPLLHAMKAPTTSNGLRRAALSWAGTHGTALTALGRCGPGDACPSCRDHRPCPSDLWPDAIADIALGKRESNAKGFLRPNGVNAGTGVYTTWVTSGVDARVADAAVWLCIEHWRAVGQPVRADQVIHLAWDAGCRHPDIADAHAGAVAARGSRTDFAAATKVCDASLKTRHGSTHEAWVRLLSRRNQLAGRRDRLTVRPSGRFDANGRPIPARVHHPTEPHRTRGQRFARKSDS
jgi:DNA polymerase III epsilon subunit-like protein